MHEIEYINCSILQYIHQTSSEVSRINTDTPMVLYILQL